VLGDDVLPVAHPFRPSTGNRARRRPSTTSVLGSDVLPVAHPFRPSTGNRARRRFSAALKKNGVQPTV
jgi:hypothetical protein